MNLVGLAKAGSAWHGACFHDTTDVARQPVLRAGRSGPQRWRASRAQEIDDVRAGDLDAGESRLSRLDVSLPVGMGIDACVYPVAKVGDACVNNTDCGPAGTEWLCAKNQGLPGGYCTSGKHLQDHKKMEHSTQNIFTNGSNTLKRSARNQGTWKLR